MTLSIIIPTLGRDTLAASLASCAGADEIIVVLDTSRGTTELPCALPPNAKLHVESFGVTGGHAGRQVGIKMATGTHLAFFDDDDTYTPGAIEVMRAAACDRPVIFRMDHYAHGILWKDPVIRFGNVSTQMYVVPNDPSRFGSWTPHVPGLKEPGGDYTFIKETCELMGEPVWREEITSVIRPHIRKTVAVVTPWIDHLELAQDYFAALEAGPEPTQTIIVDNASSPPLEFSNVQAGSNLGFSGGSNLGLEHATADVVVFLNNDIKATRRGWLWDLAKSVEPGVLVGTRIRYDAHGSVDGEQFPYLDGWCLAGMREDFLELGGWDTSYEEPSYYGDNDLCLRARMAGMTLREIPVGLIHLGGATTQANGYLLPSTISNRAKFESLARSILVTV